MLARMRLSACVRVCMCVRHTLPRGELTSCERCEARGGEAACLCVSDCTCEEEEREGVANDNLSHKERKRKRAPRGKEGGRQAGREGGRETVET